MLGESKQGRKESHEAYKKRKEEYHKIKEEYSKKEKRFKELANKILESSANTKLEKLNAKNSSKETFYRVVKRVATEKAKSEKEVRENFNEETLIGSNDAREIRKNFEKTSAGEKSRVKIEKTEKKSSEKVEDASVDGINQVNKVDGNQEQNKTTTQDVHNFVADMILNDDAFIHDENVIKPGERMRQTFIKHLGTFVALLNEKISLNTLDKCFIATIRLEMINMRKAINKNKRSTFDYTTDEVKKFLEEKCLEAEKEGEERRPLIFSGMEKAFDGTVKRAADEMQDSLSEQLKNICSGGTNENHNVINEINEKIDDLKYFFSKEEIENFERREGLILREARKFLENVHKEFGEISDLCAQSKYSEYINDKLEKLTKYMCDLSYRLNIRYEDVTGVTDENLIKDAKDIFLDIKRCLLEDKLENALSYLEKHGKNIDELKNEELGGISKIIKDLKNGEEVTNEMITDAEECVSNLSKVINNGDNDNIRKISDVDKEKISKLTEDLKREISILNIKSNTFETLMVQSGTDLNSDGYGKFMQKVFGRYMKKFR